MLTRLVTLLVGGVLVTACDPEPEARVVPQPTSPWPRCTQQVWSADHETGDLSQWYLGEGGGEFNSGHARSSASQDVAHSGRYSAKLTIETPSVPITSGVRLFRWRESHALTEACYSAWYYFPRRYSAPIWWNVLSFKSRSGNDANDAFWSLQIGNRVLGPMFVYLNWWEGLPVDGPQRGQHGGRSFEQKVKDVPVSQWTHIEIYLRQSSGFDGRIVVWQDGVELFDVDHVRTRYPAVNGAGEWMVANYSDIITPDPATFYVDDAAIGTIDHAPPALSWIAPNAQTPTNR